MPEWLAQAYSNGFKLRLFKKVSTFVLGLPKEYRKLVRGGKLKPRKGEIRGFAPSWVLYDELATPEEIKRALQAITPSA